MFQVKILRLGRLCSVGLAHVLRPWWEAQQHELPASH